MNAQGREPARNIPADVRRAVRQRCGFGCVICGTPLYEYEHMLGWAVVKRHDPSEITLLCDRHHREKTSGLLPSSDVAAANASPFNLRDGTSTHYSLHFSGDSCEAIVGTNRLAASTGSDFVAVMIDGLPILGFRVEDGHYLLNLLLFNSNNELMLQIVDNELVYSLAPWDIEFVGTRLIIRTAQRDVFVDMTFEPPAKILLTRGRILCNGAEIFLRPDYALIVNNAGLFQDNSIDGGLVALNVGTDARQLPSAVCVAGVPRYNVDRKAALKWARERLGEEMAADMPTVDC